jgi:hypothetical protein
LQSVHDPRRLARGIFHARAPESARSILVPFDPLAVGLKGGTELCAWNLPRATAVAIRNECLRLDIKPGAFVTRLVRVYFFSAQQQRSNLDL